MRWVAMRLMRWVAMHPMRWVAMLMTTLALAACGGSSAPAGLALNAYLVRNGEEPGYELTSRPAMITGVANEVLGDPLGTREQTLLRAAGFHSAVRVRTGSQTGEGIVNVLQLRSIAGATRLMASDFPLVLLGQGHPGPSFHTAAVPGAVGMDSATAGTQRAVNLMFREGRCVLIIGQLSSATDARRSEARAARAIYRRTSERPGACSG